MSVLGRRAEREGIRLPGHTAVTVDEGGQIVPTPRRLDLPDDAFPRLADEFGTDASSDRVDRVMVEDVVEPQVILQLAREPGVELRSATRGSTLHRLGTLTMNLPIVGGAALGRLLPLVEGARCYETTWAGSLRIPAALIRAVEN
jgi:hypothetical protein